MLSNKSDINLLIKPRNARILREMRARGWTTVSEMCRESNLNISRIGGLVNMTVSPLLLNNEWSTAALKLAQVLCVTPDILWPEHMRRVVAIRTMAEVEVSLDEAMKISSSATDPGRLLEYKQIYETLLGELSERERAVVMTRMDGATLKEAGQALGHLGFGGVSKERVRQIETRAHRKMRRKALTKFNAHNSTELFKDL